MTGYKSKKAAALAKTIDKINWADHETNGLTAAAFIAAEESKVKARYGYVPKLHPSEYIQKQPAQEPAAWMQSDEVHISLWKDDYHTIPLYTSPPQRPWVGLTDEEGQRIVNSCQTGTSREIFRAIEAKLKEKNNGA